MSIPSFRTIIGALFQVYVVLHVLDCAQGGSGTDEQRLMNYLQNRTNPDVRPVKFANQTLRVRMYMALTDFNLVDKTETLEAYTRVYLIWKDKNIKWTTADYPGIRWTTMPINRLWTPELQLLNRRDQDTTLSRSSHLRLGFVNKNGYVWVAMINRMTVPCPLNLVNFPFDRQTCYLNFSNPLYSSKEVSFSASKYVWYTWWLRRRKNSQWNMLKSRISTKVVPAPSGRKGSNANYVIATAQLDVERVSSYYTFVYITPVIVVSMLTVATFILPSGNSQKLRLGTGLLVLYSVMFLELGAVLPDFHSTIPLLNKYYMAMYVLLALSILFNALTINLTKRSQDIFGPPEAFRQLVIDYLGKAVCLPYNPTEYKRTVSAGFGNINVEGSSSAETTASASLSNMINDWLHIAAILDRLLLVLYLLVTVITTIVILKSMNT